MTTITLDAITLPWDLEWPERYKWDPWVHSSAYAADGELILEAAERQAGRPIVLKGSVSQGWITREALAALTAKRDGAEADMTLTIGADSFTVRWDRANGAIEATPLHNRSAAYPQDGDVFSLTLRFLEV